MTDFLRPSGRNAISDRAIGRDLDGESLRNCQFERLVATKKRFKDCDFSFSQFESAYLRNCSFDSCKFVGCKFVNSNLRGCRFEGCTFDYAEFSQTQIDPDILDVGLPGHENLQQKMARTLRVNFQQIGDTVSANKAIRVELSATRVHLFKAWRSRESYYRKKYVGLNRLSAFFEWLSFVLLDVFWGNGESAFKLLRSLALFILAIALLDVYLLRDISVFGDYVEAAKLAPQVFVGTISPSGFSGLAIAVIACLRYVMLACLVSILVKRFSRR